VIDPAITGLAGACCCAVALRGMSLLRSPSAVERRELQAEVRKPKRPGPTRALVDQLGARFGPALLRRMGDARREAVARRLDLAGRPGGMTLERYAELKAALLLLGVVLTVLFFAIGSWLLGFMLLAIGWFGTDLWLRRTGRLRQERMERDLPDFIDILAVTVRAGTGYRSALTRVADSLEGPASEEVVQTLRQMDLGATRREAFEALRTRNSSPTLDSFVASQLQAEELGVPLADALASIADDTRRAAAQESRRRAQRATPRITLIAISLLLPATIILIVVGIFVGSGIHLSGVLG
jgi:tight adherence protein C